MDKFGTFSQKNRITRNSGPAKQTVNNAEIRQEMNTHDEHYHADKLGIGEHGAHEGWIKAEEAELAAKSVVSAENRQQMISVAAYHIAEKRGFSDHDMVADWLQAETEIDALHESL